MNLSNLSRTELIGELLSPIFGAPGSTPHVCDGGAQASVSVIPDAVLTHRLSIARELVLRDLHEQMRAGPLLSSPQAVRDWLCLKLAALPYEIFGVLWLDNQNRLIEYDELFRGTLSQTSVYPREVVKQALMRNAAAAILVHNHPSGVAEPSRADEMLTRGLKDALAMVDVKVADHFIVARDRTLSFAETGRI